MKDPIMRIPMITIVLTSSPPGIHLSSLLPEFQNTNIEPSPMNAARPLTADSHSQGSEVPEYMEQTAQAPKVPTKTLIINSITLSIIYPL